MKRYFQKFAPILAIFGLAALVFAIIRGKAGGAQGIMAQIKALFTSTLIFALGCYGIYDLIVTDSPFAMAVIWGTVALSTTGTFSFNFVPQFIEFVATNNPTLFQINVNGDGMIFNLDTNGMQGMTGIRTYTRLANSFMFQLADGLLNNKNGTVTITTAATAVTVRAWSPNKKGTMYLTYNPAAALATQSYNLTSFAYASFPSAATTDSFQLSYNDGSLDNITREELQQYLAYFEATGITKYSVDNIAPARISQVTFTPIAAQTFYVMKYQAAYGPWVNQNPNV